MNLLSVKQRYIFLGCGIVIVTDWLEFKCVPLQSLSLYGIIIYIVLESSNAIPNVYNTFSDMSTLSMIKS